MSENSLVIYNSLSQQKEIFKPLVPGKISLYVCGVTTYDYCHIGHARIFIAFDVIVRFLRASGWQVNYVQNITDIDDKIIKRAQENGESIDVLTQRFINYMHDDMQALQVALPDKMPKVSDNMDKIIALIALLIKKKAAYLADNGDVYFDIAQYPSYGQLAHKDLAQLKQGARVEINSAKRSPLDFALWKQVKAQEPSWPSPWGQGRPGWHIECSAMAMDCLGHSFDLHGGGADLLFPHHENERAQSEAATHQLFAHMWMHVGFVQVDKEKMSKSLNNFQTIRETLTEIPGEVLRLLLISSHYRSQINFAPDNIKQAQRNLVNLYRVLRDNDSSLTPLLNQTVFEQKFFQAMNDDFNTPQALAILFELIHEIQQTSQENKAGLAGVLKKLANILGLLTANPNDFLQATTTSSSDIQALITQREQARLRKDWVQADALRAQLAAMGVQVEDSANTTQWHKL